MLNFLYDTLEKSYPEEFMVSREVEILELGRKASWDKAENGINELKAQMTIVQKLSDSVAVVEGDKFKEVQSSVEFCSKEFGECCMVWEDVQKEWKAIAVMYCKDVSKIKPEVFFGQMFTFGKTFQNMKDEIAKKKVKDEEDTEKKTELEKKKSGVGLEKSIIGRKKKVNSRK